MLNFLCSFGFPSECELMHMHVGISLLNIPVGTEC